MKKIILASKNPVKIQATQRAFQRMFPREKFKIQSVSVVSEVRSQPLSNEETLQGAQNRVKNARHQFAEADYWVGIEGGIEVLNGACSSFAWVVVRSPSLTGKSRTGTFFLPPPVASLIQKGKELGEADDIVFNQSNSKQKHGAIGILTGGVVNRVDLYEHAIILALVVFKNGELYQPGGKEVR